MRVVITGATGYVGHHVADNLRRHGHSVYGMTRNIASPAATRLAQAEVIPVDGDLREPHTYRDHLDHANVVVHCAADEVGDERD